MNYNSSETIYIKDKISKCEDVEELKTEIFPLMKSQQEQWQQKINEIISEKGFTKSGFAKMCGVSRVSVDKWCKGSIPKNRETFLRIGMAAGCDVNEMNHLLQRYGRYPALYAKSLEDCICIYVLNGNFGEETIEKYNYILEKIKESILCKDEKEMENVSTAKFEKKLSEVSTEEELEQFILKSRTPVTLVMG